MGERGIYRAQAFGGDAVFSSLAMRAWFLTEAGRVSVNFSGGYSGVILCLSPSDDGTLSGELVRWKDYGPPFDEPPIPVVFRPRPCTKDAEDEGSTK